MPFETVITAPDGSDHVFESDVEPTQEQQTKLFNDFTSQWQSYGQSRTETLPNAFARGASQSAASLVEGIGDITGADSLSGLGRSLKESAASVFDVDPARESDFSTKAAGVVGQALEQAGELMIPISKFGAASRVTRAVGLGSAGIKGADAGEDVSRQFGVEDDPWKRAGLMAGFAGAEIGTEALGGFGAESILGRIASGDFLGKGAVEFTKQGAIEGLEESGSQIAQNAVVNALVTPEEAKLANQKIPGYLDDTLESFGLGVIGGFTMASPHLLNFRGNTEIVPTPVNNEAADIISETTGEQAETSAGLTAGVLATQEALTANPRTVPIRSETGLLQTDQAPEDLTGSQILAPPVEEDAIIPEEEITPIEAEPIAVESPAVLTETQPVLEETQIPQEEIPNEIPQQPETLDEVLVPEVQPAEDGIIQTEIPETPPVEVPEGIQEIAAPSSVTQEVVPPTIEEPRGFVPIPSEGERTLTGRQLAPLVKNGYQITLADGEVATVVDVKSRQLAIESPKYGWQLISPDQPIGVRREFIRPNGEFPTDVLAQGEPVSEPVARQMAQDIGDALKRIGIRGDVDVRFLGSEDQIPAEYRSPYANLKGHKGLLFTNERGPTIFLNREKITSDTPIHEFLHGYVPVLREQLPDVYRKGVELLEGNQEYLQAVRQLYPELNAEGLYDEALTSLLGMEGRTLWEKTARNKAWVNRLRQFIARVKLWLDSKLRPLGLKSDMTLEQWAKMRNLEIFVGKPQFDTELQDQPPTAETSSVQSKAIPSSEVSDTTTQRPKASVNPSTQESGLGQNRFPDPRSPDYLTEIFRNQTYEGQSGTDAVQEAQDIFNDVESKGGGWDAHVNRLQGILTTRGLGLQDMTPGAYFGRVLQGLRGVYESPDSTLQEKDDALARIREISEITADNASQFGRLVKGFDFGWKLALPEQQVDSAERSFMFPKENEAKEHIEALQEIMRQAFTMHQEGLKELAQNPEEFRAIMEKVASRQIRGEDTGDAAEAEIDANSDAVSQTAAAAATVNLDWLPETIENLQTGLRNQSIDFLKTLRRISKLNELLGRDAGKASKQPGYLSDLEGELAGYESLTPAQLQAELAKENANLQKILANIRNAGAATNPSKRVKPTPGMTPEQQAEFAGGEMARVLSRMVEGKKNVGQKTPEEIVMEAVIKGVMQKAGINIQISDNTEENRALAFGLLLSNQDIASQALEKAKALLSANPETKDLITSGQLKAFGQMVIGKQFSDDPASGAPFGLQQVAQIRRAEMQTAKADVRKIVMDASLANKTAETIENQLRDPARGFEAKLGKEGLDKMVRAVVADYRRTLAEREQAYRERSEKIARLKEVRRLVAKQGRIDRAAERAVTNAEKEAARREKAAFREEVMEMAKRRKISEQAALKAIRDAQANQDKLDREETRQAIAEARRANRESIRLRQKNINKPLDKAGRNPEKVIDYLIRRHGLDIKDLQGVFDEASRLGGVKKAVSDLVERLGFNQDQARQFIGPVVEEGMKYIDAKRKAELKRRLEAGVNAKRKRKAKSTELQKITRLIELGALNESSYGDVLLGETGKHRFTDSFKANLTNLLKISNDPSTPQAEANWARAEFARQIEAAKGTDLIRLVGETTMAHIFGGLNTQKVNFLFGGIKAWMDNAIWANAAARTAGLSGAESRSAQAAILKAATRAYSGWSQAEAKYLLKTGFANSTEDPALHFSGSMLEIMRDTPDFEVRYTPNGKVIPQTAQRLLRRVVRYHPYVRRAMTSSDLFHRTTAWELLKASQAVRALSESGTKFDNTKDWLQAIDEMNYGPGGVAAAHAESSRQAAEEIRSGKLAEQRRGVRIQELMDARMSEALGMSGPERLETLREEAKRWTLASPTPGLLGWGTEMIVKATKGVPGLSLLVPAVRVPINAMYQALDWSPYGFLRAKIANSSDRTTESVTKWILDRDGTRKYPNPASLITDERVMDLRTKALIGSGLMTAVWIALAASLKEDDDKAWFFITARGPEDAQKQRDFKARGLSPYSMRIFGLDFNYRESPLYAILTPAGAWSDAKRYGKYDAKTEERIATAIQASMRSVTDQAVLKSLVDAMGIYAGGETRSGDPIDVAGKVTSRIASSILAPNLGRDVNQIIYGTANTKEQSWAGNALQNVPFVQGLFRQPAINALGDEIHEQRGGLMGEAFNFLGYRVATTPVNDPQLHFVARMGLNKLSTKQRTKTGEEVMEDYDLVRKWAKNSGQALRKYLTNEKMAEFDAARKKDPAAAEELFDARVKDIRDRELQKLLK